MSKWDQMTEEERSRYRMELFYNDGVNVNMVMKVFGGIIAISTVMAIIMIECGVIQ